MYSPTVTINSPLPPYHWLKEWFWAFSSGWLHGHSSRRTRRIKFATGLAPNLQNKAVTVTFQGWVPPGPGLGGLYAPMLVLGFWNVVSQNLPTLVVRPPLVVRWRPYGTAVSQRRSDGLEVCHVCSRAERKKTWWKCPKTTESPAQQTRLCSAARHAWLLRCCSYCFFIFRHAVCNQVDQDEGTEWTYDLWLRPNYHSKMRG